MNRALTKPRLVTRKMTEEDMEAIANNEDEADHIVEFARELIAIAWGYTIVLMAIVILLFSGAIYAMRFVGWV